MADAAVKFSEHGLAVNTRVDIAAVTPQLRRHEINVAVPSVVANSTTATGFAITRSAGMKVAAAYLTWYGTVPAQSGGTTTIQVDAVAADGTTVVVIVTAVTILTGQTANVPLALTLAATNPTTLAQGTSVKISIITSNNTVQTSGAGYGFVTFTMELLPDTTPTLP